MGGNHSKKKENTMLQNKLKKFKEEQFNYFLLIKTQLKHISHRKIVQIIYNKRNLRQQQIQLQLHLSNAFFQIPIDNIGLDHTKYLYSLIPTPSKEKILPLESEDSLSLSQIKDLDYFYLFLGDLDINFFFNHFDPKTFGKTMKSLHILPSLKKLGLSLQNKKELQDEQVYQLQKAIENMPYLISIKLILKENPNISLNAFQNLLKTLQNRSNLLHLELNLSHYETIQDQLHSQFSLQLPTLPNLQSLTLQIRNIQKQTLTNLFKSFRTLNNLKKLHIEYFNFKKELKPCLQDLNSPQNPLKSLKVLSLIFSNQNSFNDDEDSGLTLINLTNLVQLDLDIKVNVFSSNDIKTLFQDIKKIQSLRFLKLNLNQKWQKNPDLIPYLNQLNRNLPNLGKLQLNMSYSSVKCEDILLFSVQDNGFPSLSELQMNFSNNNIYSEGIAHISKEITKLKNLQFINLNFESSYIGFLGIKQLCENLRQIPFLQKLYLNLRRNYVNDAGCECLLQFLEQAENIKEITLDINSSFDINTNTSPHYLKQFKEKIRSLQQFKKINIDIFY